MEFKLTPIKEKPKKNDGGWLKHRTKKPDKYDFKGKCNVEAINIKKGEYL